MYWIQKERYITKHTTIIHHSLNESTTIVQQAIEGHRIVWRNFIKNIRTQQWDVPPTKVGTERMWFASYCTDKGCDVNFFTQFLQHKEFRLSRGDVSTHKVSCVSISYGALSEMISGTFGILVYHLSLHFLTKKRLVRYFFLGISVFFWHWI